MALSVAAGLVMIGKKGSILYPSTANGGIGPLGNDGGSDRGRGESGIGSICIGEDGLESGRSSNTSCAVKRDRGGESGMLGISNISAGSRGERCGEGDMVSSIARRLSSSIGWALESDPKSLHSGVNDRFCGGESGMSTIIGEIDVNA